MSAFPVADRAEKRHRTRPGEVRATFLHVCAFFVLIACAGCGDPIVEITSLTIENPTDDMALQLPFAIHGAKINGVDLKRCQTVGDVLAAREQLESELDGFRCMKGAYAAWIDEHTTRPDRIHPPNHSLPRTALAKHPFASLTSARDEFRKAIAEGVLEPAVHTPEQIEGSRRVVTRRIKDGCWTLDIGDPNLKICTAGLDTGKKERLATLLNSVSRGATENIVSVTRQMEDIADRRILDVEGLIERIDAELLKRSSVRIMARSGPGQNDSLPPMRLHVVGDDYDELISLSPSQNNSSAASEELARVGNLEGHSPQKFRDLYEANAIEAKLVSESDIPIEFRSWQPTAEAVREIAPRVPKDCGQSASRTFGRSERVAVRSSPGTRHAGLRLTSDVRVDALADHRVLLPWCLALDEEKQA